MLMHAQLLQSCPALCITMDHSRPGSSVRGILPVGILASVAMLFGHSVVSDSLRPRGLQHVRLPCPSAFPRICSKLMSTELMTPPNHLILCPLFSSGLSLSQQPPANMWYNMWCFMTGFFDLACSFQGSSML